jgi:undecaprenyl-diphosphatase
VRRVDEAASLAVALAPVPGLRPIERVAATANGQPVWWAASAALAAAGRRGRRAAAEGLAALAVASTVSNLAIKPVVARSRPLPVPRRRGRPRPSGSFPSSHAATGFAYASAVTCRWPAAGVPLLGLAAAVAGSRVHARHHRLTEVVAGAALGIVAGAGVWAGSQRLARPT